MTDYNLVIVRLKRSVYIMTHFDVTSRSIERSGIIHASWVTYWNGPKPHPFPGTISHVVCGGGDGIVLQVACSAKMY